MSERVDDTIIDNWIENTQLHITAYDRLIDILKMSDGDDILQDTIDKRDSLQSQLRELNIERIT